MSNNNKWDWVITIVISIAALIFSGLFGTITMMIFPEAGGDYPSIGDKMVFVFSLIFGVVTFIAAFVCFAFSVVIWGFPFRDRSKD